MAEELVHINADSVLCKHVDGGTLLFRVERTLHQPDIARCFESAIAYSIVWFNHIGP